MAQVFSTKKIILIAISVILILTPFVMLWYGCFSRDSFSLDINANEIYSAHVIGPGEITCRNEIQRIVRRLNSYRLTVINPSEAIVIGATPRASLTLFDEYGYSKWVVVMRGERQIQIAQTENTELIGWHRIRGLRGWFAPGAF